MSRLQARKKGKVGYQLCAFPRSQKQISHSLRPTKQLPPHENSHPSLRLCIPSNIARQWRRLVL